MAKLIELIDAKRYMKIEHDKDDQLINTLVKSYSKAIQNWTHLSIISDTFSETFDIVPLQDKIFLNEYPLTSIVAVTNNSVAMVEDTDYYSNYTTGVLTKAPKDAIDVMDYIKDYWYEGYEKVEVTYVAGYAEGSIPDDIQLATMMLVNRAYYDRGVDDIVVRSMNGERIERATPVRGFPPGVVTLLDPYTRKFE